jgi:hypothetical protein
VIEIRREQLQVFEEILLREFEEKTVAHVREFFPGECASAGAAEVRDGVRLAIRRAREHGFVTARQITKYVSLMFTFGRDFDRDPALPWVGAILRNDQTADLKIDRLYIAGIERGDEGGGFLHRPEGQSDGE